MEEFARLRQVVEEAAIDIEKAEGGNQAAGVRARKAMQEVKKLSQAVRTRLLELRQKAP